MEEIKNWWGVFGLFGCVTVVSSSLERRCHRQGSLAALINPAISIHWRTSRECYSLAHAKSARMEICWVSVSLSFFFFFFYWALNKVGCLLYHRRVCISFDLHSMCSVNVLVGLVTRNSYTEPVSTPNTSTTLVCWNGLRLLFNVLLLLDPHQLYWVSTVPVEPLYHIGITDALSL